MDNTRPYQENFLTRTIDAVTNYLPHYELAFQDPNGWTYIYQTSPLETLAIFMDRCYKKIRKKPSDKIKGQQQPYLIDSGKRKGRRNKSNK